MGIILLWFFLHTAQPIKLAGSDLGRHIKNGELVLSGVTDVLYKNYYSYTCSQYPAINHHWLFGVFSYLAWRIFDFPGLSVIYAIIMLVTLGLFFRQAQRLSSFSLACAFGLLSFPLTTCRCEIRPEGITILFCALFWELAVLHRQGRLKTLHLYLWLAFLQVIWVNSHVFFILGPLLIALWWFQAKIDGRKDHANALKVSFWLTLLMCLVNPSGLAGALLPLEAFKKFCCDIIEEQSVFYVLKNFPHEHLMLYFLASIPVMILPWVMVIKTKGIKPYISMVILMALFTLAAIKCIRFISSYGFFFIPLAALGWSERLAQESAVIRKTLVSLLVIAGILVSVFYNADLKQKFGPGLAPGVDAAARFFKKANLKGPIYNDYETGGYLIFYLSPRYKFFIDNRKEAYPDYFFKDVIIPLQLDDKLWEETQKSFPFNVIFFDRNDATAWGHRFIISRLNDPAWAVVFADRDIIIFLKRNSQNSDLIARYGLHTGNVTLQGDMPGYVIY